MPEVTQVRYAIVGAGTAGIAAAEAIREVDRTGTLRLVNGEAAPPYCRPLVVELLTGERTREEIGLRDLQWFTERDITLTSGDPVTKVDVAAKRLTLASGRRIEWEKLLIAAGSQPACPPIAGLEQVPTFNLYRQEDAEQLKSLCRPGARALLVGVGLIGLQAMTALKELGVTVSAIEVAPKVLPMILDARAAHYAERRLVESGIEVRVGTSVRDLRPTPGGACPFEAVTDGGERVGFDFLVMAAGMRPNLSLVGGLDIATGRGIQVSPSMQTSVAEIYAAGDVTEYANWIEGRADVHAHWVNAYRQGRIAGLHMAGGHPDPYEPVYLNSLRVFGLPIITMGASRVDAPRNAEVYMAEAPARPAYRRLVVRGGELIAATFVNDVGRAGMFQYLMRAKVPIGDVAQSLLEEGRAGFEFLEQLHAQVLRGDVDWPASMDQIGRYRKNHSHTRWGKDPHEKSQS